MNMYQRVTEVRAMCIVIACVLGHTEWDDIDYEPHSTYQDKTIRIDNRNAWMDLHAPNEQGLFVRAFTVGGLTCKGDFEAMERVVDHIKGLYIAAQFVDSKLYTPVDTRLVWKGDFRS